MPIIGLTGGIASGKSAAAAALAQRGAVVFDADKIGHQVLDEPAIREELVARWGPDILDAGGRVSRPAVAERVFGDSPTVGAERQFLEQAIHPRIRQRIETAIRQLPDMGTPAVVIDAALLIESGWDQVCTVLAFVDCPRETRLARAAQRGMSADEFSRREAAQMPIDGKRRASGHVIDNSGDLANLDAEVGRFWAAVVDRPT